MWTTAGAAAIFLGATGYALTELPTLSVRVGPLVLAALLGLAVHGANAAEYRLIGRLMDQEVGWREAVQISLLASAANLLPLPGSAIVKIREMTGRTGRLGDSARATVLVGIGWMAAALLLGAGALALLRAPIAATVAAATGGGMLIFVGLALPGEPGLRLPLLSYLLALESVLTLVIALRLFLVLTGLELAGDYLHAVVLSAANPLASAAGIFPAGLGLRELLAGALAPLARLAPETGVAATGVERVVAYVATVVVAAGALGPGLLDLRRDR